LPGRHRINPGTDTIPARDNDFENLRSFNFVSASQIESGYPSVDGSLFLMNVTPEAMAEMGQFIEDARKAGIVAANGGLQPKSTRIRLSSGKVSVTDGPFIEGKEFIPGRSSLR